MPDNDNNSAMRGNPPAHALDAHGQAALLLTESLIHGLCEKNLLTTMEAIEITERAASVQADQAEEADGAGEPLWRAHALLASIATSLRIDGEPPKRI